MMRLAMSLPSKKKADAAQDRDPREEMSAEVIDFASRTAYPAVTQRKGKSDALGLAGGIGIVALLGLATLWGLNSARTGPQQAAVPAPQQAAVPAAQQPVPTEVVTEVPGPQQNPAPSPVLAAPPQAVMAMNPNASPTLIHDNAGLPVAILPPGADAAATGSSASDFANRVGGVGGGTATATRNFDPQTTVTQGTLIPAVLETAINTDVPGYVRAIVSQDVRSYDGRRILVPRSSRLIGQYQSGLQAGQKRAYVIWTRLIRPDGVSVALASPGTDFSGQTGLPGDVNNHFFKRFGSAMLLSVIGGVTGALTGGAGAIVLGGTQSAAGNAVNQTGNIAPTVRVRQGEPIRVFTARDLDFSTAPQL
jgi:type IV secretion system protein VirB10